MQLTVRKAETSDAEALVRILNPIIEAGVYTVFDTPFTIAQERSYIESFPRRGIFLVAVRAPDNRVLGFQSMEPFAAYTSAFDHVGVLGTYVSLAHRRQGVARILFEATFQEARCKGYEKIFTFVRADNPGALAAYRNQGFSIVGRARRHAKLRGRYVDEVLIEKFL